MCVYVCGYTHGGVRVDVRGQLVGADSLLSPQGPGERTLVIRAWWQVHFGSSLTFTDLVGTGFSSFGGPA